MRDVRKYLRANPQVFVLLLICVVLGIGTFLAVIFSLAGSGGHSAGYPEGAVRGSISAALTVPRVL
jgi:hypothetical protein